MTLLLMKLLNPGPIRKIGKCKIHPHVQIAGTTLAFGETNLPYLAYMSYKTL